MNIIVTNNMIKYDGFMKLRTLKEANDTVGSIDFLVYHKSNETRENKVEYLTKLKSRVGTLIYIRGTDAVEQAVKIIVEGSGGRYFDDEFFLENSEELSSLINSLDEVTAIAELGGLNVIGEFFNRYLKNGSTGFNPTYLEIVKSAVSDMVASYKQKDLELLQLSETATEIFSNSANILSKVESERKNLEKMVNSLELAKQQASTAISSSTMPNLLFFPRVNYPKEKTIIRVKELGNCSYLTSFMLGFRMYLEFIKYVKPKLIFIYPIGSMYETWYKDFNWVTQKTYKTMIGYNNIVFTNFPTKEVITKLLDDNDYDTFIVVDRLKADKEHILNAKGTVKYAVSGSNVLSDIKASSCFSSNPNLKGTLFSINQILDYPEEKEQRERKYLNDYKNAYESLYTLGKLR